MRRYLLDAVERPADLSEVTIGQLVGQATGAVQQRVDGLRQGIAALEARHAGLVAQVRRDQELLAALSARLADTSSAVHTLGGRVDLLCTISAAPGGEGTAADGGEARCGAATAKGLWTTRMVVHSPFRLVQGLVAPVAPALGRLPGEGEGRGAEGAADGTPLVGVAAVVVSVMLVPGSISWFGCGFIWVTIELLSLGPENVHLVKPLAVSAAMASLTSVLVTSGSWTVVGAV